MSQTSKTLTIQENEPVLVDPRTQVPSLAKPFRFPTGESAIIIISNIDNVDWKPSNDIEKITITFKHHDL